MSPEIQYFCNKCEYNNLTGQQPLSTSEMVPFHYKVLEGIESDEPCQGDLIKGDQK